MSPSSSKIKNKMFYTFISLLSYHLIRIQYNLPSSSSLYTQNLLMTLSLYTPYLHIVLWKLHSTVLMFCRYVRYVYTIHSTDTLSLSLHALCTMHSLPGLMMPYFCYHCSRPRSRRRRRCCTPPAPWSSSHPSRASPTRRTGSLARHRVLEIPDTIRGGGGVSYPAYGSSPF